MKENGMQIREQIIKLLIMQFAPASRFSVFGGVSTCLTILFSNTVSLGAAFKQRGVDCLTYKPTPNDRFM
jgi:hypothetical protein